MRLSEDQTTEPPAGGSTPTPISSNPARPVLMCALKGAMGLMCVGVDFQRNRWRSRLAGQLATGAHCRTAELSTVCGSEELIANFQAAEVANC